MCCGEPTGGPGSSIPPPTGATPKRTWPCSPSSARCPRRMRRAYAEVNPLADGWEDRVGLFQLVPLLVHTVLFGGGYRGQAEALARRYV